MIGSLAPQGINVVVIIVIFLSLSFSMVRDAIIPGIPHPEPINIGINDFPDKPNFLKILSMIKATLAIYPQLSRNARNKNNTNICGTNPNTAPTPATIPSNINPFNQSAQCIASNPFSTTTGTPFTHQAPFVSDGSGVANSPSSSNAPDFVSTSVTLYDLWFLFSSNSGAYEP